MAVKDESTPANAQHNYTATQVSSVVMYCSLYALSLLISAAITCASSLLSRHNNLGNELFLCTLHVNSYHDDPNRLL